MNFKMATIEEEKREAHRRHFKRQAKLQGSTQEGGRASLPPQGRRLSYQSRKGRRKKEGRRSRGE